MVAMAAALNFPGERWTAPLRPPINPPDWAGHPADRQARLPRRAGGDGAPAGAGAGHDDHGASRPCPGSTRGEELGLDDGHIPAAQVQDPLARKAGAAAARDPARTPMPWAPGPRLGFTTADRAWLAWGDRQPEDTVQV
jgi:glycosidase